LYRCWMTRKPGVEWIVVGFYTVGGDGRGGRRARLCCITRLEVAGLIEVMPGTRRGQVTRVRVIDAQLHR
jgi:hypothetical protein